VSSIEPLELARSRPEEAGLANLLATRHPSILASLRGEQIAFELAIAGQPLPRSIGVGLAIEGRRLRIDISEPTFRQLSAPWAVDQDIGQLPAALRLALLSAALAPLVDGLRALSGMDFRVTDDVVSAPLRGLALAMWQAPRERELPDAVLHLDGPALAGLIAVLERLPPAPAAPPSPELPVALTIAYGTTRLSVRELRALEPGDVLLIPPGPDPGQPPMILRQARRPLAAAHFEDGRFVIDRLMEDPMSEIDPMDVEESPIRIQDPDEIEVRIDFELSRISLPLGELRNIRPGYSFELDVPAPGSVRIVSGGREIGRGELVRIGDRLGVRVTELFSAANG